jgi:hypothetical protein
MAATQATTYSSFVASNAINSNTSSSDTAVTDYQVYPLWRLDMGSNITLNRLRLYQYSTSQERLSNFYVILSQHNINLPATPSASDISNLISDGNNTVIQYSEQIPAPFGDVDLGGDQTARYMIIVRDISSANYLQMAEVEAYRDQSEANRIIDGDNDTQIQVEKTADDDIIRFDTEGTERMVINSTGNVGIGTAIPSAKLHVVGDARITDLPDGTSGDQLVYIDSDGNLAKINAPPSISATAFKVKGSTWQAIAANNITTVEFSDVSFDTNNGIDLTNNRFQPTAPGYYQINVGSQVDEVANTYYANIFLRKNNVVEEILYGFGGNGVSYPTFSGSTIVYLNGTSDYIDVMVTMSSAHNIFLNHFSGHLIGN